MQEGWFDRVVDETAELTKKIRKLRDFLSSDAHSTLSKREKDLLDKQHTAMCAYVMVLNERIGLEIDNGAP